MRKPVNCATGSASTVNCTAQAARQVMQLVTFQIDKCFMPADSIRTVDWTALLRDHFPSRTVYSGRQAVLAEEGRGPRAGDEGEIAQSSIDRAIADTRRGRGSHAVALVRGLDGVLYVMPDSAEQPLRKFKEARSRRGSLRVMAYVLARQASAPPVPSEAARTVDVSAAVATSGGSSKKRQRTHSGGEERR